MTKARDLADLLDASGNIIAQGTIDGRDLASDGSKLDGIESGATADQTHSEIRALIVDGVDTNVFTDADHTKLDGIEANATADQTASEIRALVESATDSNVFTDADHTKLNAIESGATADQTKADIDALNINADTLDGQHGSYYTGYTDTAVANLVDSAPGTLDTLNELAAALGDDPNFATTVTNSIATKLPLAGGTMTGDITFVAGQTFDGRDVSVDGTKLDGIEAGATGDQTASEIRALVEAATDSNVFTDADHTKLNAIEANAKDDQAITAGSGLTGGGTGDVTLSHSDTSSQGSVNNSGATVVQDVTLDTYGHVTGLGSHTLTLANLGYTGATNANYITNNNQLSNGAGYTTNVGDITNVTAGTNLTGGGSSGSVTVNLTASPNITSLNVGSSEVVSSSRALKNITSVDATTAASITAAGVGGGGELTFTASEAITAGDLVSLTSSGQIQQVKPGFGPEAVTTLSSPTGNPNISSAYSPTDNKFVMAWKSADPEGIYAAVGTIASNGSVTRGSAVQIVGSQSGQDFGNITYVSGQNAFVIAWTNQAVGGQVRACKISGTSLSLGSSATLRSHSGGSVIVVDMRIGSSGGSSAIAQYGNYYSGSPVYARGMTLSGTSISLGNEVNLSANGYRNRKTITYDSTAGKTILSYGGSSEVRFRIATMSGNTMTLGNTATLSSYFNLASNGVHDPVSGKNVFTGQDGTNISYIASLVVTISGSSISLGSLTDLGSKDAVSNGCTTDGNGTIFVLLQGYNNSGPEYMFTSVSGTTLPPTSFTSPTPSSAAVYVAQPFYDDNTGYYGIVYNTSGGSWGSIVNRAIDVGGGISAWIGAAAENISSGSSGKVTVVGGINENQSGLSIGTSYGLPPSTGVLTPNASPKIGMATAATKLFITTGGVSG